MQFSSKNAPGEGRTGRQRDAQRYLHSGLIISLLLYSFIRTFQDAISARVSLNFGSQGIIVVKNRWTRTICGQIAGAYYGQAGIPVPRLDKHYMRDEIISLAEKLAG